MAEEKTPIQKLYDRIPSFTCREGCYDCCDNQIQFAPEEAERVGGFNYTERLCPHVKEGRCSVHQNRAFICRIYGSSEIMPCPHGYGPEKPLTKEETYELLREYLRLMKEQEETCKMTNNIPCSAQSPSLQSRDTMTDEQFNTTMAKGLEQAKGGQGVDIDEAFDEINKSI